MLSIQPHFLNRILPSLFPVTPNLSKRYMYWKIWYLFNLKSISSAHGFVELQDQFYGLINLNSHSSSTSGMENMSDCNPENKDKVNCIRENGMFSYPALRPSC
jgi:hypothetical protein